MTSNGVTLRANYTDETFDSADYSSNISTIDASAVTHNLKIMGNGKANDIIGGYKNDSINGGAGNDELWGNEGSDVFVYKSGAGKDIIYGFDTGDTLTLDNLTFTTSYANGAITFNVGTQNNAVTLKDFTATTFHIDGESYKISGTKLVSS